MISAILDSISRNLMAGFFMFAGTGVLIWMIIRLNGRMAMQDEQLEDRIAGIEAQIAFIKGKLNISNQENRKVEKNESGKDDQDRSWNTV